MALFEGQALLYIAIGGLLYPRNSGVQMLFRLRKKIAMRVVAALFTLGAPLFVPAHGEVPLPDQIPVACFDRDQLISRQFRPPPEIGRAPDRVRSCALIDDPAKDLEMSAKSSGKIVGMMPHDNPVRIAGTEPSAQVKIPCDDIVGRGQSLLWLKIHKDCPGRDEFRIAGTSIDDGNFHAPPNHPNKKDLQLRPMGRVKFGAGKQYLPESETAGGNSDKGQNAGKPREFSSVIGDDLGGSGFTDFWWGFGFAALVYLTAGVAVWWGCLRK